MYKKVKNNFVISYQFAKTCCYIFVTIFTEEAQLKLQELTPYCLDRIWQQMGYDLQLVLPITLFIFSNFLVANTQAHVHRCFSNYIHAHTPWTSDVTGLCCIQFDSLRNAPPPPGHPSNHPHSPTL